MSYIDFSYYSSHFPKLEEEEFNAFLPAAEMKAEVFTRFRCQNAQGYKLEQVKAAIANLINTMAEQEKTGAGNGITSASNDGYSESYAVVTKEQKEEELKNICFDWLSGTGLMGAV